MDATDTIKSLKELQIKKMSSYSVFAQYYDFLNQNVDYNAGSRFISGIFKGNKVKTVIDLACGTGVLSEMLGKMGYEIIGIDMSDEMLSMAQNRLFESECRFSLINAKMQDFSLEEKADACICCLDSINHLTDENDVLKTFKNVSASIKDNGIFIFDVNSVYKHRTLLNNRAYVFDEEDFFLSWDNEYLKDDTIRIMLDFFIFNGKSYDRESEEFFERAYSQSKLKSMLKKAGFGTVDIYGGFDYSSPKKDSERLFFVCRKG